jgi:iron complex transport system substrate-binding protein
MSSPQSNGAAPSPTTKGPRRIVCLTEETTETLYLLGEQDRIVGISGFTVRPSRARKEKPKVSAFTSAKIDKILALEPDLVLGFSDLQADIAAALVRAGLEVHIFNQRSVEGILDMILRLGAMIGATQQATRLVEGYRVALKNADDEARQLTRRPRVYFEEWDEPMISGIGWVSELIQIAGGEDCFPELGAQPLARQRIIADPQAVIDRQPDIIIGSWCGKRFRPERVRARPGWNTIPAVRWDQVHEIKSAEILQPGPAALTDGLNRLRHIIDGWAEGTRR